MTRVVDLTAEQLDAAAREAFGEAARQAMLAKATDRIIPADRRREFEDVRDNRRAFERPEFGDDEMLFTILDQHTTPGEPLADRTPITDPDHCTVGQEFGGTDFQDKAMPGKRWFCFSHDRSGFWMYATDGSGHWTNVSERAIGRSFHQIHRDEFGVPRCHWFRRGVPPYVVRQGCHGCTHRDDWKKQPCDRTNCPLRQEFHGAA